MEQARAASSEEQQGPSLSSSEEGQGLSAGQYLDKALNLIGKRMRSAASLVREKGPREGFPRNALESASDVLDSAGRYMMREHPARDVGGLIKRYPGRSLVACFLVGFVAGSASRRVRG